MSEHQQSLTEKADLSLVQFSSAQTITEICFENFLSVIYKDEGPAAKEMMRLLFGG